jgi:hypothetical protein
MLARHTRLKGNKMFRSLYDAVKAEFKLRLKQASANSLTETEELEQTYQHDESGDELPVAQFDQQPAASMMGTVSPVTVPEP